MKSAESRERIVALIPMREHSARVPGKNIRTLGGAPLYHHIVKILAACPSILEMVIDTDSRAIWKDVEQTFPEIRLLERPAHLRADDIPMTEVLVHDVSQVPADWYVQTHSTNPFLKPQTIERAIACWRTAQHQHDSLFSVTRVQARMWDHQARPMNHHPEQLLQTQALPPVYLENSCLYIFPADLILSSRRRIGNRPKLFEIDPSEALDIDEERDFAFAELLMRARESSAQTCPIAS